MTSVQGLLLAAGAGRRMGRPKALLRDGAGVPYVVRAARALHEGGCDGVTVVLGAAADEVMPLLEGLAGEVVVADDWAEGMGASLRAGLTAAVRGSADAVVVTLVDLPDVGPSVVRRLLAEVPVGEDALARSTYDGRPGHPVLLGRRHWAGVVATARGDRGARDYLGEHRPILVECGDLASGRDVDRPEQV